MENFPITALVVPVVLFRLLVIALVSKFYDHPITRNLLWMVGPTGSPLYAAFSASLAHLFGINTLCGFGVGAILGFFLPLIARNCDSRH